MIYLSSLDTSTDAEVAPTTTAAPVTSIAMAPAGACVSCMLPIMDQYFLLVDERCWHYDCLCCCVCRRPLHTSTSCFFKDGLILCRDDYRVKYSKRCSRCCVILERDDIVMRAKDSIYHLGCFTCAVCASPLRQGEMFTKNDDGTLFCQVHCRQCTSPDGTLTPSENDVLRLSGTKQRYRKWKKASDDIESATDSIDYCEDESVTIATTHKSKRMRTSFKHHQLRTMKTYFNLNHNPDAKDLKQLAQRTGLTKRVLQVWFQNARAKFRRNNMQAREAASISPQTHRTTTSQPNEQVTCNSTGGSLADSLRTSVSPDDGSQRGSCEQSTSSAEEIENSVKNDVDAVKTTSPVKTLAEYFEADPTLL